ncbi:hypothetical protein C4F51_10605 [Cellvibrio sp. KB43]|uniref:Uncharacterized protein n=1 Tax=Cellvibrio polysaccharolyticus TaxID=2082724 RepID=A0A928V3K2_9GAMM|nr:hypothetical protein [Cellvibrio polysaccharolyticus]
MRPYAAGLSAIDFQYLYTELDNADPGQNRITHVNGQAAVWKNKIPIMQNSPARLTHPLAAKRMIVSSLWPAIINNQRINNTARGKCTNADWQLKIKKPAI